MNILLVCTGNTCRSPMATDLLKELADEVPLQKSIKVKSAGTFAAEGIPATDEAIYVMNEKGYDIKKHRSVHFNKDLAEWADIILTMEAKHIEHIEAMVPEAEKKCHTLLGYVQGVKGYPGDVRFDIADPFGEPMQEYGECFEILEQNIRLLIDKLNEEE